MAGLLTAVDGLSFVMTAQSRRAGFRNAQGPAMALKRVLAKPSSPLIPAQAGMRMKGLASGLDSRLCGNERSMWRRPLCRG
jgi:hypothetical protein